ncbi:microtubule-associated serine/threonine-protein kinase 4-like [Pteropus vampyrus]|uniref:Microtubule-associated serine/threonine-protein kinase 4-like n=1 Tax=Pteropus vampyrus TaxID=132908 RepID=A0A6P3R0I0_PTEVA|nr:microtubule-associated serine/threonine-protein kinase 4-like [Pteropus vampyrus]
MGEKVSEAPEPVPRSCSSHGVRTPVLAVAAASSPGASSAESSSGSETLSEEGEPRGFSRLQPPPPPGGALGTRPPAAWAPARVVLELGVRAPPPPPRGVAPPAPRGSSASQEEQDEELDHILSPPPMPCRKCSNPDVASGLGKSLKFKRQLSEDGRQLRRGSLGGALTGRYLLPTPVAGQAWSASAETSNLVRMRNQALGQSAPSLTASLPPDKANMKLGVSKLPPTTSSFRSLNQLTIPTAVTSTALRIQEVLSVITISDQKDIKL